MKLFGKRYDNLFNKGYVPDLPIESQRDLGKTLFTVWLEKHWDLIKDRISGENLCIFLIASDSPDVLNLPWELLLLPEGEFLGIDPKFSIRRMPYSRSGLPEFKGELRSKPLRLFFMACSPANLPELDFEAEEESLIKSISGSEVAFDSGDLGTFFELQQKVEEFKPHIVHLTGHGTIKNGLGTFAFEDENGKSDPRSSEEIQQILIGIGIQCVFVNGCKTGRTPQVQAMGGICQGLIGADIPFAIGWASSIGDEMANHFSQKLYQSLAAGRSVDHALHIARRSLWEVCKNDDDPSWTLPVLYTSHSQREIVSPDPSRKRDIPTKPNVDQKNLPGMNEGYADSFVGRRREQQRIISGFVGGNFNVAILTGMGGSGKSALATRIARKLEAEGYYLIPIQGAQKNTLTAADILLRCGDIFRETAVAYKSEKFIRDSRYLDEAAEVLENPDIPIEKKLSRVINTLKNYPFLLILDNFESSLDENSKGITDIEIKNFYLCLLQTFSGASRVIITTRYLPRDRIPLPNNAIELTLGDFSEASFVKCLRRDDKIDSRYQNGDLPHILLHKLFRDFGGTPRFVAQMRSRIANISTGELQREIYGIELPFEKTPDEIHRLRDQYYEEIFVTKLYNSLSPESQLALSKIAVFQIAVNIDGLSYVTSLPKDKITQYLVQWRNSAFVYPESVVEGVDLWATNGMLRNWLFNKISDDNRLAIHKLAGTFLRLINQMNWEGKLGLSWFRCLTESRQHYIAGKDITAARLVTEKISNSFLTKGLYNYVRKINLEILQIERHPILMNQIGITYLYQGNYFAARQWFEDAMNNAIEDQKMRAISLHHLATIDLSQGDYVNAKMKLEKALEIEQFESEPALTANTLHQLATIDLYQGKYNEAKAKLENALKDEQISKDLSGEAATHHQLAVIHLYQNRYTEAREGFEKAYKIKSAIGDRVGEAICLQALASVDQAQGRYMKAIEGFESALDIYKVLGDQLGEASIEYQLASIDVARGKLNEALPRFQKVLSLRESVEDQSGVANTLLYISMIHLHNKQYTEARRTCDRALTIKEQIGDKLGQGAAFHQLASIDLWQNQLDVAKDRFKKAFEIRESVGDFSGEAATLIQLGNLAEKKGLYPVCLLFTAIGCYIEKSIGHGDAEKDHNNFIKLAEHLRYNKNDIQKIMNDAENAFQGDHVKSLIDKF